MSTKLNKPYMTIYCSFFDKTYMPFSSVVWRLNEDVNLTQNNIPGDILDTSLRRGKNTERVTSVNVNPVSLT